MLGGLRVHSEPVHGPPAGLHSDKVPQSRWGGLREDAGSYAGSRPKESDRENPMGFG